jgi:hypothetical protein
MPFIQALTYTVTCQRLPGIVQNTIHITPLPSVGSGSGVDFVELTYNMTATTPPALGSIAQTNPLRVYIYLSVEDFEIHRMIFQTEAPIEIEWETDPNVPSQLSHVEVRTQAEPVGEGPVDKS